MGHRACVRMVKIIMGNHACRLSVPRAAGPAPARASGVSGTGRTRGDLRTALHVATSLLTLLLASHARDRNRQLSAWD